MIHAQVRKSFPARADASAFDLDAAFETAAGVTSLFGPSGAGKTLLLNCIAGIDRPDSGRIMLDDAILFDGAARVNLPPQSRDCGYVFQNYALFPHMTLRENLMFAAERQKRLERHRRVNEMLERFRLTDVAGRKPHEVSGGQRQRCSIARALVVSPKLLLLDEPATGLDAPLRFELYEVLRQVRAEFQTPILMVTHDLDECFELAEEMIVLDRGRVVQTGSPRAILDQPSSTDVARLLGAFNLWQAEIVSLDPGRNSSVLRFDGFDLRGHYLPGHFKGDRVTACVRADRLIVTPGSSPVRGANQVAVRLDRAADLPAGVRLEFSGSIRVQVERSLFDLHRTTREWIVECPTEAIQILGGP